VLILYPFSVLDICVGDKLVIRFVKIDKIFTAYNTSDKLTRPYRYGCDYVDENLSFEVDSEEKKVYFEFSEYLPNVIFYENHKDERDAAVLREGWLCSSERGYFLLSPLRC